MDTCETSSWTTVIMQYFSVLILIIFAICIALKVMERYNPRPPRNAPCRRIHSTIRICRRGSSPKTYCRNQAPLEPPNLKKKTRLLVKRSCKCPKKRRNSCHSDSSLSSTSSLGSQEGLHESSEESN
ncbi:hypothetical protein J437_LFUL014685 [Ladona fulva]|uniref:Uncharacterized protein n=1 Tax=Ladona fulva TaxID=123851 RepID=A0A8K0KE45_LADFU|nr:hypothetical protein J437_LFUL014685 [Ladona fulva]